MKRFHFPSVFLLSLCFLPMLVQAQASTVMDEALYNTLKTLRVDNLDRDTYVVFDEAGVILDRYELKPASVFNFSDGIERKVYLYLVYPMESEDTLGCVAFYQREDQVIALPVPGKGADKAAWGLYIDDLKYTGEDEPGFLACVSFVISREFAGLLAGTAQVTEDEDEYEYCFPADARVTLADGRMLAMEDLRPGIEVLSVNPKTGKSSSVEITSMDIHMRPEIALAEVLAVSTDKTDESIGNPHRLSQLLRATPNHPILTNSGSRKIAELKVGDQVFLMENGHLRSAAVMAVKTSEEPAEVVYSPRTNGAPFLVDGVLVLPK